MNGNKFYILSEEDDNKVADRYPGFQSDVTAVLNMYRELRDITAQQGESLNRAEENIDSLVQTVKQGETELVMAEKEDVSDNRRKMAITASIVSGTLLTAVVGGAPVAVPIGVVAGLASWMIWKK
jgi:hypothetical protein